MKYSCLVIFLLLFISQAKAQNESELLKKVKAKLDKVANYQAAGEMSIDVSFIKAAPAAVTVYYKKPDKFKVIKQNGISLLPKGGVSINISSLLLTSDYAVVPAGTAVVKGTPVRVVKLLPTNENSDIVITTLYIDEKNAVIKKSAVTTKENGSYEIDMEYGKYIAWGLPDAVVFSFNAKDYKLPKALTFDYEKGDKKTAPPSKAQKGKVEIKYSSYLINKGIDDKVFEGK